MIIYAVHLSFVKETQFRDAAAAVAEWLRKKHRREVNPRALLEPGDRLIAPSHRIEVESMVGAPSLHCIRYSHPDAEVHGRLWVTEIGLRKDAPGAELECSILLKTDEVSARVSEPVQPTRPGVVREILRNCRPSGQVPGLSIQQLDCESAEAFHYHLGDPNRNYPIVVMSTSGEGGYPVAPEKLQELLLGLAEVVLIPEWVDTFLLERMVGRSRIAWGGALRIVYPPTDRSIPSKLILKSLLEDLNAQGIRPEREILSLLLHRVNLANSRRHISGEEVRRVRAYRELETSRNAARKSDDVQGLRKYIGELEEMLTRPDPEKSALREEIRSMNGDVELKDDQIEELDDEVRRLKYEIQGFKETITAMSRGRAGDDAVHPPKFARAVVDAIEHDPTPEECLEILSNLFADRLVVLDSAWRSAEDSRSFRFGCKLFGLLNLLVNDYYEALGRGEADSSARKVFGERYSARESETIESSVGARNRRTFKYNGQFVEMMKHLKIGVKDSATETIRVHFEWMAVEKKIVIGHCGPHIPFR